MQMMKLWGQVKEEYGYSRERVEERKAKIEKTAKAYGGEKFYNLAMQPAGLDKYDMSFLMQKISEIIKKVQPNTVILPY